MRVLIIQHDHGGHAGRFRAHFDAAQIETRAIIAPEVTDWPDPDSFDALWVMGGVPQVWETEAHPWLVPEITLIRRAVLEAGKPYFGICFGHQLLAAACGGAVGRAEVAEVGMTRITGGDRVLGGAGARTVFQWHSAQVTRLPPGFETGWASRDCPIQTMAGPRGVRSVQFHPEVDTETLKDWYDMPGVVDDLAGIGGAELPGRIMAEFERREETLAALGAELFDGWLMEARGV
ncbi:type 1 glutamine amidotransferase [Roseovarius spongiae]|nr:type 1 glutamine amidotransferase [Roseovarius spongiae]